MGKLTKCPTCKKEMAASANACPHCGETNFLKEFEYGTKTCPVCHQSGLDGLFYRCKACNKTGRVKKIQVIDSRTGADVRSYLRAYDGHEIKPGEKLH